MKLRGGWACLLLGILAVVADAACSGKTVPAGGLMLIIATNLNAPTEFDTLRVEVSQEISPGQWGTPLLANDFRVPDEAMLPTTVAIAAGKNADQNARIRVIALKGTSPQVLRQVEIQVPTQRVAALKLVLADPCLGQVRVDDQMMVQSTCPDPSQSCQPDTGVCGPNLVDSSMLPDYVPGDEKAIDAGARVDGSAGAPSPPLDTTTSSLLLTTLAGSVKGFADGAGAAARFDTPYSLAVDGSGNVYVGDENNHRVRKITAGGVVTTLAGSATSSAADGTGPLAGFNAPSGIAVDAAGNVYVADTSNNNIRKVTAAGVATTLAGTTSAGFADGTGAAAKFNVPIGIAVDGTGNVYVGDNQNNRIRKVTAGGVVTTLAGSGAMGSANGPGAGASFRGLGGVTVDPTGNVYAADSGNSQIRKTSSAGAVTTLAGTGAQGFVDGVGAAAAFSTPYGVAVDGLGNVFVADTNNLRIRKVTAAGVVTTLAGSGQMGNADGVASTATFKNALGIAVDAFGNIYIADTGNDSIRKLTALSGGKLAVSWGAPTAPGSSPVTGYVASATAMGATKTCSTTGVTFCTVTGLTPGTAYSVSVTATNAAGTSAPSTPVTVTAN